MPKNEVRGRRARWEDDGYRSVWELKLWVDNLLNQDGFDPDTPVKIGRASANPFRGVIIVEEL